MRLLLLSALLASSFYARADSISQSFETGPFTTNASDIRIIPLTLTPFNPSAGTLDSIFFWMTGSFTVVKTGALVNFGDSALVYFIAAGNDVKPDYTAYEQLQLLPYGGTISHFGTGEYPIIGGYTVRDASSLAYLTGVQTVDATFVYTDVLGAVDTSSGIDFTLTYNYTSSAATPEPSSLTLLTTAVLVIAGAIKRRLA